MWTLWWDCFGTAHLNFKWDIIHRNRTISWQKWVTVENKSAHQKCQIRGTVRQAVNELLQILKALKPHLFRANWNRNIFDYARKNLTFGQVIQILDFSQNYQNMYQDEVQSAYWTGTQTAIQAVINYFPCQNSNCHENVTLVLAQITDDLAHDSFVSCAGHTYLAQIGCSHESYHAILRQL